MVVDSSALIAVLLSEPAASDLITVFESGVILRMSTATLAEGGIVMQGRQGDEGEARFDRLVQRLDIAIVPVTREHAEIARAAFRRFGKGRHPAGLNFGDCFSYALARSLGEPLLFVGHDFAQTDIEVAPY